VNVGFVDTSCLVAITFGEAGAKATQRRLATFDVLLASSFLEAELISACTREGVRLPALSSLSWVTPTRRLSAELSRVLETGYVRGADAWHLATALYVAPNPSELCFLSLDIAQTKVAKSLGFQT
jgi:uncharacterized protein with PIN domain